MTKCPGGSGGLGMSEGAKSPAALRGQGGPVHACVYVCAGGGNHGSASGFRASGPHRSKKTCPLVEPSLAAAWPFCPCRPSIFFPAFFSSLFTFSSIPTAYIFLIWFSYFSMHGITPWPASPMRGRSSYSRTAALLFLIAARLISEGVKQEWVHFLRPRLLASADTRGLGTYMAIGDRFSVHLESFVDRLWLR